MGKRKVDFGSKILTIVLIAVVVLLCLRQPAVVYDETQTMDLTSYGLYDDGNAAVDMLEFYAISGDYESEFLSLPAAYGTMIIDTINTMAFQGTPVRHVLLPETITKITFDGNAEITMYTDDAQQSAMCAESGFSVGSTEVYHNLVEKAQKISFSPKNIVPNFGMLAGTYWVIAVVVALQLLILQCAKWREKAGFENPLDILKKKGSLTNGAFMIVQFMAAFLTFYAVLYYTEDIGLDSDWLLDIMTNWPLKITIGLFGVVLFSDAFNKKFFPWYFGRIYVRCFRVLIPVAIAAGLGAFLGAISTQFGFIIHLIAAAPVPLFFIGGGILIAAIYGRLGIYHPPIEETGFRPPEVTEEAASEAPKTAATTTLIAPDGTAYPVRNVGYGYMVNGRMLLYFDPHGTNRPVDEDGTEYTRY